MMTDFWSTYGEKLLLAVLTHIEYVVVSVVIGSTVAIALGILLSRAPRASRFVLPVIGIFQTVPGIVFIGILMVYLGMRPLTVIVALSIYAVFPVLKNTYTGILNVDPYYIEVAKSCGMRRGQILRKVELPLAMNAILAGVRMSTVYTVSWAVLAAMIGQGGLGEFIYIGVDTNIKSYIIIGSIPAAILAIAFGYFIDRLQKAFTPRGMRRQP